MGFEVKKKWKEIPIIKKVLYKGYGPTLGNIIFITFKPLWILNEFSQIPQILPGILPGVDDVVILQIKLILKKCFFL